MLAFLFALLRSHSQPRKLTVLISCLIEEEEFARSQDLVRCTWKAGNWVKVTLLQCWPKGSTYPVSFFPSLSFLERDLNFGAFQADYGVCKTHAFQKGHLFGLFNTFASSLGDPRNAHSLEDWVRPPTGPEASGMCLLLACTHPSGTCTPCLSLNSTPYPQFLEGVPFLNTTGPF